MNNVNGFGDILKKIALQSACASLGWPFGGSPLLYDVLCALAYLEASTGFFVTCTDIACFMGDLYVDRTIRRAVIPLMEQGYIVQAVKYRNIQHNSPVNTSAQYSMTWNGTKILEKIERLQAVELVKLRNPIQMQKKRA